jgi:hypothetical protein
MNAMLKEAIIQSTKHSVWMYQNIWKIEWNLRESTEVSNEQYN